MIDLHTHTLLSDGELLPSELARRAEEKGYTVLVFTDHIDFSNVRQVVPSLIEVSEHINRSASIKTIPGVEITHVSPVEIPALAKLARDLGARIVVVHGETLVEPVAGGTNRKALESDIDILAHPGLMTGEEAKIAADRRICVELSARKGHSLSNGHVAGLWYEYGFPLVLNTDTHTCDNLIDDDFARLVIRAAGVEEKDIVRILDASERLAAEKLRAK